VAGSGGIGTTGNPFLLGDLLNSTNILTGPVTQGPALTVLVPGDTLNFLAGNYHISGSLANNGGYYNNQLISPTTSGTLSSPITLRAAPGAAVAIYMDSGAQPVFGTTSPLLNYVRFLGFTIASITPYDTDTACAAGYIDNGTGNEFAFNEIVGTYVNTSDNCMLIRLDTACVNAWVHHNYLHDQTGLSDNVLAFQLYGVTAAVIEDNYLTANSWDFRDKAGATIPSGCTYRRNWFTTMQLNNNGGVETNFVYDNVVDGRGILSGASISLQLADTGTQIYNNLIYMSNVYSGHMAAITAGATVYETQIWNNVMLSFGGASPIGFSDTNESLLPVNSTSPVAYMDFNVYDQTVSYLFADGTYYFSTGSPSIQSAGFESHASIASVTGIGGIFVDETSWLLQTAWQTAGRYDDPVGPRTSTDGAGRTVATADIINASRYGPAAIGSYS
jgi:hypothetical protein